MARHDSGGAGGLLTGITIGALVGAAVALLFAPQSGDDTRAELSKRAKALRDDASDYWDDTSSRARREFGRRKRRIRERMDDGVDEVRRRFAERG